MSLSRAADAAISQAKPGSGSRRVDNSTQVKSWNVANEGVWKKLGSSPREGMDVGQHPGGGSNPPLPHHQSGILNREARGGDITVGVIRG